jgi:hypothetical protein
MAQAPNFQTSFQRHIAWTTRGVGGQARACIEIVNSPFTTSSMAILKVRMEVTLCKDGDVTLRHSSLRPTPQQGPQALRTVGSLRHPSLPTIVHLSDSSRNAFPRRSRPAYYAFLIRRILDPRANSLQHVVPCFALPPMAVYSMIHSRSDLHMRVRARF